jgi:outer membrane protein assembly factor BamB
MSKNLRYLILFIIAGLIAAFAYFQLKGNSWTSTFENTATSSSCRTTDLNNDGILDIVLGAGTMENKASENGVIALNGQNGKVLWKVPCRNQIVGSAIFNDINGDGTKDVFIGGRSAQLFCIDGTSGTVIWEYLKDFDGMDLEDTTMLNFYNPQFIPDQDKDGIQDILISFGGYVPAAPADFNRPHGSLFVFSGKTGKQLVQFPMPDYKETYFSPAIYDFRNDGNPFVLFGSGGETITGEFYAIRLTDLMNRSIDSAKVLANGQGQGFIATPIILNITKDDIADIIITSFSGRTMAIDGNTFDLIWTHRPKSYRVATNSTPAPVEVNNDGIMDFFCSYGEGVWNEFKATKQVVIDGKTGKELLQFNNRSNFLYSSPIVGDFTQDGKEDILLSVNVTTGHKAVRDSAGQIETHEKYATELLVFDLQQNSVFRLGDRNIGTNLCSTPLISDVNKNGKIEVLTCFNSSGDNIFSAENLIIECKELPLDLKAIRWGAYMGSNYDNVY